MLLIVIGIGLYYNVIIAWIIYYLIEVFISLPTGRLPWTTCGNRWTIENLKIVDEPFFSSWNTENCMDINSEQENDSIQANSSTSTAPQEFFSRKMLELSPGIDQVVFVEDPPLLYNYHSQIGEVRLELAGCLVLAWFIVFLALIKGVKSLGKAVYFTAIFPYVILTVLLCFGLSLDGAVAGILYYVTPRLDRLTDVQGEKNCPFCKGSFKPFLLLVM